MRCSSQQWRSGLDEIGKCELRRIPVALVAGRTPHYSRLRGEGFSERLSRHLQEQHDLLGNIAPSVAARAASSWFRCDCRATSVLPLVSSYEFHAFLRPSAKRMGDDEIIKGYVLFLDFLARLWPADCGVSAMILDASFPAWVMNRHPSRTWAYPRSTSFAACSWSKLRRPKRFMLRTRNVLEAGSMWIGSICGDRSGRAPTVRPSL